MRLTPEILRAAADLLWGQIGYHRDGDQVFMCWAVLAASDNLALAEFSRLLVDHGVTATLGGPMADLHPDARHVISRPGPQEERQAVRFMFLEFLALSMEDDQ